MGRIAIVGVLAVLAACIKPEYSGMPRNFREEGIAAFGTVPGGTPEQDEEKDDGQPHLYLTAVSGADILVFRDGELSRRVHVGERPDPHRHRVRRGHLFRDEVRGRETVVFKDGGELFRYKGEEFLAGFALLDGHVHTLGQRAGGGFSYRIDGRELFSSPEGIVIGTGSSEWADGAFTVEDGNVFYSYGIPLRSGGKTWWEYRVMNGAEVVKTIPAGSSGAVCDIRVSDGVVYVAELENGSLMLARGDDRNQVVMGSTPEGIRLAKYYDAMCIKGFTRREKSDTYWFRNHLMQVEFSVYGGKTAPDFFPGGSYYTVSSGKVQELYHEKKKVLLEPGKYILGTPLCAGQPEGEFCIAMSDTLAGKHVLFSGSGQQEFTFPGYFTSLRKE